MESKPKISEVSLGNQDLKIQTRALGAELTSIIDKDGQEYLWQGHSTKWERKNPVLFPIIATIKNDHYNYGGQQFHLPIHGFALNENFQLVGQNDQEIIWQLESYADTKQWYPFNFILQVKYFLEGNKLKVSYNVRNTGNQEMPFCVGGHPTFACPLEKKLHFNDYLLAFEQNENILRLTMDGALMSGKTEPLLEDQREIPLQKSLFQENAIVTKNIKSRFLTYQSGQGNKGVRLHLGNSTHLGIFSWSESLTDEYICIEPWIGLPGFQDESTLEEKEGVIILPPEQNYEMNYVIEIL